MVSGTMTSRRYHIPLLFFVLHLTVHLSEAGCHDYFQVETWKEHLTQAVDLVATKDAKDVMPCSVKKQCDLGIGFMCAILSDCYEQDPYQKNDKCQEDTLKTLPFYLFMCRTARDLKHTTKGCEYENECELTTASTSQRGSNKTNTEWMTTCEILLTALVGFLIIIIGVLSFCLWKTKKRLNRRNLDVIYNCDAAMEDQPHLKSNTHTSVSPEGQLETTFLMQTLGSGTHPGESN